MDECNRKGVFNKTGKPFQRHSLITLLSNPKYVGKWYLNPENKDKPQDRLPPQERYHEIDLPHGVVVDEMLWNQIQQKLQVLANGTGKYKNGNNRVYPLSGGLLRYQDGTVFRGYCGNGKTQTSYYYRNTDHRINIKAGSIETDAIEVLSSIIKNDSRFQEAIKRYGSDVSDHKSFLETQLIKVKDDLTHTQAEKKQYMENLSVLLKSCTSPEEMSTIKDGFSGTVINDATRVRAETVVEDVPGVFEVHNHIVLESAVLPADDARH